MERKNVRLQAFIRIGIYLFLILYAVILGNNVYMGADICPLHRMFGVLCSTCGATRAALSLLRFDISAALEYNPVFTLGVFPIAAVIICEDTVNAFIRLFSKKNRLSIAERILIWLRG